MNSTTAASIELPLRAGLEDEIDEKAWFLGQRPAETITATVTYAWYPWPIQLDEEKMPPPNSYNYFSLTLRDRYGDYSLGTDVALFSRISVEAVMQELVYAKASVRFGLYDFSDLEKVLTDWMNPQKNGLLAMLDEKSELRFLLVKLLLEKSGNM